MGSRIKNFFARSNNNANLQTAKPYHAIVASDPPVKGSYPVAGNGPNVLQEIQRTRAQRQSIPGTIAPASNDPRQRQHSIKRPRTAPHDGTPGGGHTAPKSEKATRGRSLSGFSMKSPPKVFSRRNSVRSNIDRPPLPPNPNPASPTIPRVSSPPPRDIKTYTPTHGSGSPEPNQNAPDVSTVAMQHTRNFSQASHKSHVDLLDAHSNIKRAREATLQRYEASGVRIHGEDVADRNIDAFGDRSDPALDLDSPQFSYLRSVYAPRKAVRRAEPHSRVGSAAGHVLAPDESSGVSTQTSRSQQPSSISTTSARSGPRPVSVYPPRVDSAAAASVSYGVGLSCDGRRSAQSNGTVNSKDTALPLPLAFTSISEQPAARDHRTQKNLNSARALSTPPIPERGRGRPLPTTTTTVASTAPTAKMNPPPVAPPGNVTSAPYSRPSTATSANATSTKAKRRSLSATSQSTVVPPATNGGTSSRKGSVSFSAFHGSQEQAQPSRLSTISPPNRQINTVDRASKPPSLKGVVGLENSTNVTTKQLPAVVHEHVTPTRHEIRQEVITRETHPHDVYHRVLPVVETETGRASTDSAPDGPVISLARVEPRTRSRSNSKASSLKSPSKREQFLSRSKKVILKDGIPRTESVWRHPPVFEPAAGQTQPVYVGAGTGDLSGISYSTDEDDDSGAEFGAVESATKTEAGLLFKDLGYGSGGMLPGLVDIIPSPTGNKAPNIGRVVGEDWIGNVRVPSNAEGKARTALRRTKKMGP